MDREIGFDPLREELGSLNIVFSVHGRGAVSLVWTVWIPISANHNCELLDLQRKKKRTQPHKPLTLTLLTGKVHVESNCGKPRKQLVCARLLNY